MFVEYNFVDYFVMFVELISWIDDHLRNPRKLIAHKNSLPYGIVTEVYLAQARITQTEINLFVYYSLSLIDE